MRITIILLLLTLNYSTMHSLTRPTVSLIALNLGESSLGIGFITSLYTLLPLLVAIRFGKLIDQFKMKIPLVLSFFFSH